MAFTLEQLWCLRWKWAWRASVHLFLWSVGGCLTHSGACEEGRGPRAVCAFVLWLWLGLHPHARGAREQMWSCAAWRAGCAAIAIVLRTRVTAEPVVGGAWCSWSLWWVAHGECLVPVVQRVLALWWRGEFLLLPCIISPYGQTSFYSAALLLIGIVFFVAFNLMNIIQTNVLFLSSKFLWSRCGGETGWWACVP